MKVLVSALLLNSTLSHAGGMSGGGFLSSSWMELNLRDCANTCELEVSKEMEAKRSSELIILSEFYDTEGKFITILQDVNTGSIIINVQEPNSGAQDK